MNGDFNVNQRAFAGTLALNAFGFDRWKATGAGAASLTRSAAGVTTLAAGTIAQTVEVSLFGYDTLAGVPLTLSVENPTTNMNVAVGGTSGVITAGSGRRSVAITPTAAGNLVVTLAGTGASVAFRRVQLSVGTTAADQWSERPYDVELRMCQRYFQSTYNGVAGGTSTSAGAVVCVTPTAGVTIPPNFPQRMRAAPTISLWSTTGVPNQLTPLSGSGTPTATVGTVTGAGIQNISGGSVNVFYHIQYHANAEL